MSMSFEKRCKELVAELKLGEADDVGAIEPLTGGVSSEIALVNLAGRKICVKFALEQLNVAQEWRAQVRRSEAEYQWLLFASSVIDGVSPRLYGYSSRLYGFAMEFIEGEDISLWKSELLKKRPDRGEGARVGNVLGILHKASAQSEEVKRTFQNQEDFYSLRLDPYLIFTRTNHPDLYRELSDLVEMLQANSAVLVHGDVSPKNILLRGASPVFLDAECATMGDPCFDIAFCLNHLVLKAIYLEQIRESLLGAVAGFWKSYADHVVWEEAESLEKRVCRLLPALMLARVDGKSPVEYFGAVEKDRVRTMARGLLKDRTRSLDTLVQRIQENLECKK